MLKKIAKLILTFATLSLGAQHAQAARDVDVPSANITTTFSGSGVIEVISTDGNKWTEVKGSNLVFPVKVDISVPSGFVRGYRIAAGAKTIKHELFAPFKPTQFSQTMSPSGTTGEWKKQWKESVIAKCNAQLSGGKGVDETISLTHEVVVGLTAWTSNASGQSNDAMVRTTQASFPLKCIGKPKPNPHTATNDIGFDHGDMKIRGIKLFLTTYSHAYSQPNPGTKCKKVKLLVRLNASKKGSVRFKLWKNVGGTMTSKVIDAWAAHDGSGGFKAEHSEWISVNKTTYVQAKAEEMVNPIGLSTPWEDITLHCTGAGGEGLTTDLPGGDDPLPPTQKLTGDFSFIDNGGTKCPRQGKALINFIPLGPQNVHYSLDCLHGHFSGVAQTVPDGKGGYVAPALVSFDIDKTLHAKCALKSVAPGKPKVHALKGHLFQCVKRTFDPVTNDFGSDSRPPTDSSTPNKVVIDPPRVVPPNTGPTVIVDPVKISCVRGAVRNNSCYCPPKHKKTQIGRNKWRCDPIVVDPPKTPPGTGPNVIVDPVRITCLRGAVRNNSCYCPSKHKKVKIGPNAWRCNKVVIDPPKTPPGSGPNRVVDPPRRISCKNGVVRRNNCFCPRTHRKVKVGTNAWRCVKKATVVSPKKGGSSLNLRKPTRKVAPPVRIAPKKKKSKKRRSSNNSGATQMRLMRRR